MNNIVVIGAVAVDLLGRSSYSLIDHDSNIGSIAIGPGGVARNIAHVLAGLGMSVDLISPIGDDDFGRLITKHLESSNIRFQPHVFSAGMTPAYLAAHDQDGALRVGISDFTLVEGFGFAEIMNYDELISKAEALVVDTNLAEDALAGIFHKYGDKRIYVDGVSCTKVVKIKNHLNKITLLKVNLQEFGALLGKPVADTHTSIRDLLTDGPKRIVVTNGMKPIFYNDNDLVKQIEVEIPRHYATSVGAGDALLGGVIYGLEANKSITEAINYGRRLARLTMEASFASLDQVDPDIFF